jgi:microcystin-dependent protein
MGTPHTFVDPVTSETITVISEATAVDFIGHVDGANLEIDTIAPGYTDAGSAVGDIIIIKPTTQWGDNVADTMAVSHDDDGKLKVDAPITGGYALNTLVPVGSMLDYAGMTAPFGFLMCYGQAISRTTYASLFSVLNPAIGTFTITIAAPGVITLNNHGLVTGDQVYLTTTGALPTGLSANTLYYVNKTDANTFTLCTTRANAIAGTKITTTGTQSGTHTLRACPHGLGDGSTTFNVPDARGRVIAGSDAMGGTAASRLTLQKTQGTYGQTGASGGAESHTLTTAEQANATGSIVMHSTASNTNVATVSGIYTSTQGNSGYRDGGTSNAGGGGSVGSYSTSLGFGGGSHNNVQPTLVTNKIIKF